ELVRAQGHEMDGVPPKGDRVKLALTGNMSTGGTSIDRTEEAHPDNVEIAEMAARVVGLDVAGIDFICPDITVPVRETGGAIVEVARGGILREGLGFDRPDVAVVTNVTADHLGLGGISTLKQLSDVKGVIVEAVPRTGFAVLNADDPYVARLAADCRGTVVY